jgi:hypothetical protein
VTPQADELPTSEVRLIEAFVSSLRHERHLSDHTVAAYRHDVMGLATYLKRAGSSLATARYLELRRYLAQQHALGYARAAAQYRISANAGAPAEQTLSLEISIVLAVTYVLSLVFTLHTHKHLYVGHGDAESDAAMGMQQVPLWKSALILLAATFMVAIMSEFLVGAVEYTAHRLGMSDVFVGVFIVAHDHNSTNDISTAIQVGNPTAEFGSSFNARHVSQ